MSFYFSKKKETSLLFVENKKPLIYIKGFIFAEKEELTI
jgi:hypothetical protein